jgi:hypothetical protein
MPPLTGNLAVDPVIIGNLRGLTDVDIQIQTDLNRASGYLSAPQLSDLQRQLEWRLLQASLRVYPAASAALVVSIAVELRTIAPLGGPAALFAVSTTLREPGLVPRAGDLPTAPGTGRYVDVWRHKGSTGIIIHGPWTKARRSSWAKHSNRSTISSPAGDETSARFPCR